MCCGSLCGSDLTFDPSFKVKQRSTICNGPKSHLLLFALEVWDVKPTYRTLCASDFFIRSDLSFEHSFKVK